MVTACKRMLPMPKPFPEELRRDVIAVAARKR